MSKFFIFKFDEEGYEAIEDFDGSLAEARKLIATDAYPAGNYRIFADTSGLVRKAVVETKVVSLDFTKKTRKARA